MRASIEQDAPDVAGIMKTAPIQGSLAGLLGALILVLVTSAGMTAGLLAGAAWMHRESLRHDARTAAFDAR